MLYHIIKWNFPLEIQTLKVFTEEIVIQNHHIREVTLILPLECSMPKWSDTCFHSIYYLYGSWKGEMQFTSVYFLSINNSNHKEKKKVKKKKNTIYATTIVTIVESCHYPMNQLLMHKWKTVSAGETIINHLIGIEEFTKLCYIMIINIANMGFGVGSGSL